VIPDALGDLDLSV